MSVDTVILIGAGSVLLIASVSGKLERLWLTEPMVAMVLGVAVGLARGGSFENQNQVVLVFLELTLALVLFTDASRIDIGRLREGYNWPLRMLLIGMPVVIVLGTVSAGWLLGVPFGMALLIGVILAPTDAALAEPVLTSRLVPARVRQTINVESGLNDGLAVPALLIALAVIESELGQPVRTVVRVLVEQLGIGVAGGLALGWVGAWLIGRGIARGWMNPLHQRIAALGLALAGYAGVQLLGGSGFVAVFIAGGLMSHLVEPDSAYLYDFAEAEGHSLVLLAFLVFGAVPVAGFVRSEATLMPFVLAVLALVVLRPVSIWISLLGQGLKARTVAFLGWFGPRGLATIVFLLIALEERNVLDQVIVDTVTITVVLSVLAHGLTAVPMARWLAGAKMTDDMPEMGEAFEHPMRRA